MTNLPYTLNVSIDGTLKGVTFGSRSHKILLSTLYIMGIIHLQGLRLLCQTVREEMQLQENTPFDLDLEVKVAQTVTQYPLHHVAYSHARFEVATSNH